MPDIVKTMKLHIHVNDDEKKQLETLTNRYANACTYVSQYIFNNGYPLNSVKVQEANYQDVRTRFQLKSQLTVSVMKTVTARYKTLKTQLAKKPYKYKDENNVEHESEPRDIVVIDSKTKYETVYAFYMPEGEYDAELVTESRTPISFLWN